MPLTLVTTLTILWKNYQQIFANGNVKLTDWRLNNRLCSETADTRWFELFMLCIICRPELLFGVSEKATGDVELPVVLASPEAEDEVEGEECSKLTTCLSRFSAWLLFIVGCI